MSAPVRETHAKAPSPFVFVVGCPRSGTTLLQRMLDAHPELAVANDTHFVPRAVQAVAPRLGRRDATPPTPDEHRALIDWALRYRRFGRLGLSEEAVTRAAAAVTYPEFVAAVYRELADSRGKRLGGEKTPDYVRSLPLLHRLFPSSRFVHLVRDGRDVALSVLAWARAGKGPGRFELWREEPLAVAALWWRWQVGCGRREGAALPAGVLQEVRYEALVATPAHELTRVADFLGLGGAGAVDAMLAYHEGRTRRDRALSAKSAWLPPTPGLRDFRREMTPASLALFERLAGDLLVELGYPLAAEPAEVERAEIVELARRCRGRWDEELAARARRHSPGADPDEGDE